MKKDGNLILSDISHIKNIDLITAKKFDHKIHFISFRKEYLRKLLS